MMDIRSVFLPNFTIGAADVYKKVPEIAGDYGKSAVLIGGKTALAKAEEAIRSALQGSAIDIIGSVWYGGEATEANVDKLMADPTVQAADMVFGVGGGRALDTVKVVGDRMDKPVFTFPTIASNCAPVTKVTVFYNDDHTMKGLIFTKTPPKHTFINTQIIAEAPREYIWAGIGDALSKQYESAFSSRGKDLPHADQIGVDIGHNCAAPLLKYGQQAMADVDAGKSSTALAEVILNIIATTGLVSVLVNNDYNSAVAHAVYYGSTFLPAAEGGKERLHGQMVAYGTLIQLLVDQKQEAFEKVYAFNQSIGLPVCLADIWADTPELKKIMLDHAVQQRDLDVTPCVVTRDLLESAVDQLEAYHQQQA